MGSMVSSKGFRVAAFGAAVVLGLSVSAMAQQKYDGVIVAVDGKANTFTVKSSKKGEQAEMAFHVDQASRILVDGEQRLLGELVKGDDVEVTYGTMGGTHTVQHANRVKSASAEMTFSGDVVAIDNKAQTFTVRKMTNGKVEEMEFHVTPDARLYLGGEEAVLWEFQKGDPVTVAYESGAAPHLAKHVKKNS